MPRLTNEMRTRNIEEQPQAIYGPDGVALDPDSGATAEEVLRRNIPLVPRPGELPEQRIPPPGERPEQRTPRPVKPPPPNPEYAERMRAELLRMAAERPVKPPPNRKYSERMRAELLRLAAQRASQRGSRPGPGQEGPHEGQ